MRKILFVGLMVLATMALALSVSGQDEAAGPSISAGNQLVLDGTVTISSVQSDGPGFVVVYRDSGRGSPGPAVGNAPVHAGANSNVVVEVDTFFSTPLLFVGLHVDDGEEGVFSQIAGADAAVLDADGNPVRTSFNVSVISTTDQFVADNTVAIDVAVVGEPGWMVIHADNEGAPGPVIGQTLLEPGRSEFVTVELTADGQTDVLWPMLHVDTGTEGEYEFGSVEGADVPVIVDGTVAVLPIWTVPHVRVSDQIVSDSVVAESVLSEGPGFLVIHQEANDTFGGVAGVSDPLPAGLNTDVIVPVDPELLTSNVWPMLHVDTGTEGEYEFGTVEGADGPVVVNGQVVTFPIHATPFIEMSNQPVVDNTVTVERVLADQPGWVVIHQDQNGTYGPLAGVVAVPEGLSANVVVQLDPAMVTATLWPMLHVDTGTAGEYEFGTVEGADGPVIVNDQVVTFPIVASDCVLTVIGPQNANVRANPDTTSTVLRTIPAGERTGASGQTEGGDFVWWQLADGGWIRSDLVEESGACDDLPVVETIGSGVAAPAATEEAGS